MSAPDDPRWLLTLLKRTDWAKVAQRGGAFVRAMRGDDVAEVAADTAREVERSRKLHQTFQGVARAAIGCRSPAPCDCAICKEGNTP